MRGKLRIDKSRFTVHGYNRVKERTDVIDKEVKTLSLYAVKNGLNLGDLEEGFLKKYVEKRINQGQKRVKLYRGYVFIFFKNSRRLITCYPIPDYLFEDYKKARMRKIERRKNKSFFGKNSKNNISRRRG
ncbi:MAG: hypothetical protein IKF82_01060 [Bacilli bacterium]|nr:hypothetical protein [Bacilli bacterium]